MPWQRVGLPALFAIVGFVLAYLLVCGSAASGSPYSELVLGRKKEAVEQHLQSRKLALSALVQELKTRPSADTLKARDSLGRALDLLNKTIAELYALGNGNVDTGAAYWLGFFSIGRDALAAALLDSAPTRHNLPVITENGRRIVRRDTLCAPLQVRFLDSASVLSDTARIAVDTLYLSQRTYASKTVFFREHTPFALWMVFSLLQMMIWFLLAPLVFHLLNQNKTDLRALGLSVGWGDFFRSLPVPAAALVTFLVVFFFFLVDRYVVFDHYFLRHFKLREVFYLLPVYLLSGLYFGAFLWIARQLPALKNAKEPAPSLAVGSAVQSLKVSFTVSFLCAAINLSLAVIWMGILYSAVNTMEAPRFYRLVSGHALISHDLVYLTGVLHSVLLLIFYLPVKVLFDQEKGLNVFEQENARLTAGLRKTIITVLVTASPLLSAFLQKIVSNLLAG